MDIKIYTKNLLMHSYVLTNQFSLFKILSNLFLGKLHQSQCPKILSLLGIFILEDCVNTKNKVRPSHTVISLTKYLVFKRFTSINNSTWPNSLLIIIQKKYFGLWALISFVNSNYFGILRFSSNKVGNVVQMYKL